MDQNEKQYLFNASIQIGEGMALTVTGNFAKELDQKGIEAEFDKIFEAMAKQNTKRMKIPAVRGALQDQKDALDRTHKALEELKFAEQGRKLSTAERAQYETCVVQLKKLTEQVSKGEEILDALEKEAA